MCPARSRLVALAVAAAVLTLAQAGGARAQAPAPPQPSAVPVQVTQAVRRDVPILLRNIGTVQAFQSVLVRARVDGTLDDVFFQEGQEVKRGDRLAQIDPRPYAAALAQAVAKRAADAAQLANARNDLNRYQSLSRNDFASRQQVDTQAATVAQFEATLQGDDAQIATARLNLDFCNITSPIDGRVGLRMVDPGNLIHANDAQGIVSITQIHPISVIFTLPQDTLPQVQAAMVKSKLQVQAWSADDQHQLDTGELLTVDNSIDQGTGTYRLKAVFPNKENQLWPGQFVNARLQTGTRPGVVTVPSIAVQHGPSGLFVFMIKPDQTAAMRPVEVVQDDGQMAVIAKGLDDGAQVVVKGVSRLQDGTPVAPTKVSS
jgi:multidrug efflux system membrane fusion protein